jgi:hypothetical protein
VEKNGLYESQSHDLFLRGKMYRQNAMPILQFRLAEYFDKAEKLKKLRRDDDETTRKAGGERRCQECKGEKYLRPHSAISFTDE